jgi:hypothetical protein
MKQFILSLELEKNHDRIVKGACVGMILISIGMFALFLPAIFNR